MNNRRDQVARDIAALIDRLGEDKANRLLTLLVQAESAMDAEPTEAEIDAARQAYWNERRALSNTGVDTWTGDDSAWAAALIAARKAGRE